MSQVKQVLEPIYNKNSRVLILGTLPSVQSRESNFYYANKRNRFWKLMAEIFNCTDYKTIEEKKSILINNGTALWDVIESCEITGSSDSSIKNVVSIWIIITNYIYLELSREKVGNILWCESLIIQGIL